MFGTRTAARLAAASAGGASRTKQIAGTTEHPIPNASLVRFMRAGSRGIYGSCGRGSLVVVRPQQRFSDVLRLRVDSSLIVLQPEDEISWSYVSIIAAHAQQDTVVKTKYSNILTSANTYSHMYTPTVKIQTYKSRYTHFQ